MRPVAFPRHQLLTLRQTPRAGDGKERRTRQARARKNVTCSTFFPDPANMLDYPDTCQVTKGKAAGQMRNSLLRKQRNRGALQEQVSPEFSSMICVLLSFKFRFKARLKRPEDADGKLESTPHAFTGDTPVLTKCKFDQIFAFAWYRSWPMPSWAPYSFEDKEQFRNALWAAVEELLREGNRTERRKSA